MDKQIVISNGATSVAKLGRFEFPILPPSFKLKRVAATDSAVALKAMELADSDFLAMAVALRASACPTTRQQARGLLPSELPNNVPSC